MEKTNNPQKNGILDLVFISVFAAIICVSSFVTIPSTVPFTMQLFGVYCALACLGGRRGTLSIVVYILLGLIGLPVFSGFKGGAAVLFGTTGGYIIGFIAAGLIYWLITHFFGEKLPVQVIAMLISLAVCYAFGTIWFVLLYSKNIEKIGIMSALSMCVFPFIVPDVLKIALAVAVSKFVKGAKKSVIKE